MNTVLDDNKKVCMQNTAQGEIFAYFEHMQNVWKLEPTKVFITKYEITQFFLARQCFLYYGAPDVPVNMVHVAVYHE